MKANCKGKRNHKQPYGFGLTFVYWMFCCNVFLLAGQALVLKCVPAILSLHPLPLHHFYFYRSMI